MLTALCVVGVLGAIGLVTGAAAPAVPDRFVDHDTWWTRTHRFERRWYERLHIRAFKDRLPDAGTWCAGRTKSSLPGRDDAALHRFATETRRAEYVHVAQLAAPVTLLAWLPAGPVAAICAVNACLHAPFIAVQRYNRARIDDVLTRRAARRGPVT